MNTTMIKVMLFDIDGVLSGKCFSILFDTGGPGSDVGTRPRTFAPRGMFSL